MRMLLFSEGLKVFESRAWEGSAQSGGKCRKSGLAAPSGAAGRDETGPEWGDGRFRRLLALPPRLQAPADDLLPAISREHFFLLKWMQRASFLTSVFRKNQ